MAKSKVPTHAALRNAFIADLSAAWDEARSKHPKETPYAFVLYGVEDFPRLSPNVLTEEGLTTVATRYVQNGYFDKLDEAKAELRWSIADSPYVSELEERIPMVDRLFEPHARRLGEVDGYDLLASAAMEALAKLDQQKKFGTGRSREALMLFISTTEAEVDWTMPSAKKLNSKAAFKRFEKGTKHDTLLKTCNAFDFSPDGKRFYTTGSRQRLPDDENGINELIAYDAGAGMKPRRRWAFEFRTFGDSGRAVVCDPDGKSVLLLRALVGAKKAKSLVMRFAHDRNKPLRQAEFESTCAVLAISPDGKHIALPGVGNSLRLLDRELRERHVLELNKRPTGLLFLKSGELLAATQTAIVRIDPAKPRVIKTFDVKAFDISADAKERVVAVSQWPTNKQAGVELRDLRTLKLIRTFAIAKHDCVHAAISPDGSRLAFEAREINTARKFVAVFDVASGQELARRKSNFIDALAFRSDNRTMVIGGAVHTRGEAITLWKVD